MTPLILHPTKWNDYSLIDSGYGRKLERFGPYLFSRPEPQALWSQNLSRKIWDNAAGTFLSSSALEDKDEGGKWSLKENIPERWEMSYENIKFYAMPTAFRHLGFFPDQSPHWIWAAQKINNFILNTSTPNPPRILNLFGYSGLASLHATSNGASVTHVDASKKAINFAFDNRNLSSFSNLPIKYLTDDALKFVNREIRRENRYDAIILDPPKYGRGPNGEKWELQKDLPILLNLLPQILSKNPLFVILNSYAIRSSYSSLHYALREVMKTYKGKVESGEISIFEDQDDPREISTAIFARWESKNIN
ncbi:MAG: class I SAM-dependent methyltransferase [Alphaproteobacteria bacterium]|nr:class I SAM-dependent methyltransferase [Alphaproteobacteria bacterium]